MRTGASRRGREATDDPRVVPTDGLQNAGVPGERLRDGLFPGNTKAWCDRGCCLRGLNVTAVRPHRDAIYCKVRDVDEASVSYVEKL